VEIVASIVRAWRCPGCGIERWPAYCTSVERTNYKQVSTMKSLSLLVALGLGAVAHARPVVIPETSQIANPDITYDSFGSAVGLDGEYAIVMGFKTVPSVDPEDPDGTQRTVFLFRRVGGTWTPVRQLVSDFEDNQGDGPATTGVDLANGYAAVSLHRLHIFERVGTDYLPKQTFDFDRTSHVLIDGNRIAVTDGGWGGGVLVRDPSGTWVGEGGFVGQYSGSDDGAAGGPVALSGEWGALSIPWGYDENYDALPGPRVNISRHTGTNGNNQWAFMQRLEFDDSHAVGHIALQGQRLYIEDYRRFGTAVYQLDSNQQWVAAPRLYAGGEPMLTDYGSPYGRDGSIVATPNYVMRHFFDFDLQRSVVQVFQYGQGGPRHVATLVPSDGGYFTGQISINGSHVLVAGGGKAYYYELPTTFSTPALIQDTFTGTTAPGWTVLPNSQFVLAQSGYSRAFRQLSTVADAGAVLDAANWTDQAIQADVKPTAINGTDRWIGLATRRVDAGNYYYVTFRSSGSIQLKRLVQGAFQTLASVPASFALNKRYRLRLESVGSLHRVYLDGVKLLEARDTSIARGRPALLMNRAAADWDNVIASPSPHLTIYETSQGPNCLPACVNPAPWRYAGGQWTWGYTGTDLAFSQNSISDWSRAFIGPPTGDGDMTVEARTRLRAFGAGEDRWFGIMARANEDATRYVWLALRQSNTVTLRKVDHGVVTQIAATAFNVKPGTWYRLRLDTVGNRVRGYINGQMVVEGIDSQPQPGSGGLVTYKTQADYDDYRAARP
jgi:hypothetical protein